MFRISCLRSSAFSSILHASAPLRPLTPLPNPKPQLSQLVSQLYSPRRTISISPLRQLSSSPFRQASTKQVPPKPLKPLRPTNSNASYNVAQTPSSFFAQMIASAGGKVDVYIGPSHRLFRATSYIAGIACSYLIFYCLSLGLDNENQVPLLTRAMMSATSVAWMLLTWMFFSGIRGLVSRVTAVTKTLPNSKQTYTELEIRVRSSFPFLGDSVYRVTPERVRIDKNIVSPKRRSPAEQEAYDMMVKDLEREEAIRRTSFFKAPITKTSFVCHNVLRNTRYAFTKELMVKLFIKQDQNKESVFKFDTQGKFAPEYKYLEKIIYHKNVWE